MTANHLDQQFLVLGAELAEPTENVTAADWAGASFRGEGLGMPSSYDPATFTPSGPRARSGPASRPCSTVSPGSWSGSTSVRRSRLGRDSRSQPAAAAISVRSCSPALLLTAPGETPMTRLKARLKAASDR